MYSISTTGKKLAAYRINRLTIERLKTKAKMDHTSVNALVDNVLTELVKEVKSDAEIAAEKEATAKFVNEFSGIWSGSEYENIEDEIYSTRTVKAPVEL